MDNFRTIIKIDKADISISYQDKIMLIGSCFTENIGDKLKFYNFNVDVNPFGVLYNPESVKNGLQLLKNGTQFSEKDLHFYNGKWLSYYHHSRYSNASQQKCLDAINYQMDMSSAFFEKTRILIVTFGTAWVYTQKENGNIVSNCHKIPDKKFDRYRLSPEKIEESWKELISDLLKWNKNLQIIFTISPVRHLRDGAHGNQLSKAALLLAVEQLCNEFSHCHYFPSYEIMLDDLRSYRFFAEDMTHPNPTAVNYIWQRFAGAFFNAQTIRLSEELENLNKAKNHRPFDEKSDSHKNFMAKNRKKAEQLMKKYPYLELSSLMDYFRWG
jgi:hypothetical protein